MVSLVLPPAQRASRELGADPYNVASMRGRSSPGFTESLGGAIKVPGISYVNYVVPAIFLEAVLIGGMSTSLALAQDLQSGIIDRFRSLPMARSAVGRGAGAGDRFGLGSGCCLDGDLVLVFDGGQSTE
jgi:hypothetical protein